MGRDGLFFFHDGTGRYIISSTTGRDGTFVLFDGMAGVFWFSRRDGTVRIFFHCCTGAMKNTLLSAPRQQCYKLKLYVARIISSYDTIRTLSMGTNL